ncbi:hypothetical protein KC333_g7833 [Hortaea werneckii]|nr:hypothetical protein KC333_g7833 [Hortaea werneckii]KAI7309238.1 hypothetical protein KC326_g7103 [Hortaea werneckii]
MPSSTSQLVTRADMTEAFRLTDLPRELRICIYEYAFTPRPLKNPNENSEHFDSQAPSKALLLTNQLIHQEACSIYQEAYRRFWTYSVSATVETIDPRAPLRTRFRYEITRRFAGHRFKPHLKFTLVEGHLHVEIVYRCTARPLWHFLVPGDGLLFVVDNPHAQPGTGSGS